jgi:diguanylate cyclase (GGDEF)-like protein
MAARTGDGLNAVVMMDLDGFKAVNDSLGHAVGDDLLCTVADVLRAAVHPGDLVARVGGDEFVAVVRIDEGLDGGDVAAQLGERVRSALRAHPSSARVDVGVSLGVVTIGRESSDTDELLRIADERMYDAKRRTRRAGR